jgi:hypothetical protein
MKKNFTLFSVLLIFLAITFSTEIKSQTSNPSMAESGVKVNIRHPNKPTNRYLDNNEKKKKLKTSYKMVHGFECPSYMQYTSKPQKEREKMMKKGRRG